MLNLLNKMFKSRAFKILLRVIASLASAIAVISGLLFFLSLSSKEKEDEVTVENNATDEPNQLSNEDS